MARVGVDVSVSSTHRVGLRGALDFQAFAYLTPALLHVDFFDDLPGADSGSVHIFRLEFRVNG